MIEKNKTYILRDNIHLTQTFVIVQDGQELGQTESDTLDQLAEITDAHFLFVSPKKVWPEKFSELYQASGYSLSPDRTNISGILSGIEYDRQLSPGQHLYYFVVYSQNLKDLVIKDVKKIIDNSEVLRRSIYPVSRYSAVDLSRFYERPKSGLWRKYVIDRTNMYTTHTVDNSSPLVLRPDLIDQVTEFLSDRPAYLETFTNFPDFLGSVTTRIKYVNLNLPISDVKVSSVGK